MTVVLVTGAGGFIGRHVVEALGRHEGASVRSLEKEATPAEVESAVKAADTVIHLAGANRPPTPDEFAQVNVGFTETLCDLLIRSGRPVPIVFTSSTQAQLDNPYGVSKRRAEQVLADYAIAHGSPVTIFRLPNVFGKWCRPRYNSFVATLCHAVANDEPYEVDDPSREMRLAYIDDVAAALVDRAFGPHTGGGVHGADVSPTYTVTLGALAAAVEGFKASRATLRVSDFADRFTTSLYATYLSYLPTDRFGYDLDQRSDPRGSLAEFIKSASGGQIFVSRTLPGVTRGNHYHHTKTEKFLVVEGQAVVRFRQIEGHDVIEYPVDGRDYRVLDIPPGYTHSIQNVGPGEMVCVFWASEIFDPERPDTVFNVPVQESRA